MAFSKSSRIIILLVIDSIFFLIELVTGYAVHSLALVADSFHMLNDVLSLCVGLWAVKVANQRGSTKKYTYGWQRAETLGALVNGVFLVALCVTIFLDAIQRFVEPQEVSQPKLVLIVGCLGLASNIVGLFLFHDHSHGHGGHSHGAGEEADEVNAAEHGHAHAGDHSHAVEPSETSESTAVNNGSPLAQKITSSSQQSRAARRHSRSQSRTIMNGLNAIPTSPHAIRSSVVYRSTRPPPDSDAEDNGNEEREDLDLDTHDQTQLLNGKQHAGYGTVERETIDHTDHYHRQPKTDGKGGHSHGDLNMRGIFLHVMGDALGNIGVIATALVIWFAHGHWRFYFDPAISLVITCIILTSAIPLCKAASRILLQAVPEDIDVDEIHADILSLPDVIGVHHLHVWQLSDTKRIASLHVQVAFDFKGEGSARYMRLAQEINNCLHEFGIHSSTIQPEFCLDADHDHTTPHDGADDDSSPNSTGKRSKPGSRLPSKPGSMHETECLLGCPKDGCASNSCCPPPDAKDGSDGHDHAH